MDLPALTSSLFLFGLSLARLLLLLDLLPHPLLGLCVVDLLTLACLNLLELFLPAKLLLELLGLLRLFAADSLVALDFLGVYLSFGGAFGSQSTQRGAGLVNAPNVQRDVSTPLAELGELCFLLLFRQRLDFLGRLFKVLVVSADYKLRAQVESTGEPTSGWHGTLRGPARKTACRSRDT